MPLLIFLMSFFMTCSMSSLSAHHCCARTHANPVSQTRVPVGKLRGIIDKILQLVPADGSGLIPGKGLRPVLTRADIPLPALKQVRGTTREQGRGGGRGEGRGREGGRGGAREGGGEQAPPWNEDAHTSPC